MIKREMIMTRNEKKKNMIERADRQINRLY